MTAEMTTEDKIAQRFARDTAEHEMTVLHDDGLYRHLRFRAKRSFYWFDLVTVPGVLIFKGDGQSFVFSRLEDMFEFFRGPIGRINPHYWAEKVTSGHDGIRTYDEQVFRTQVVETFAEDARDGVPAGTGRALRERVLDDEETYYESGARDALNRFEHKGYQLGETWEWDLTDWDWWFLWACHAIVWGIAYYDTRTRPSMPDPKATVPRRKVRPKHRVVVDGDPPSLTPSHRRVVDVHLPEPTGGAA
jgi:hypothetical protein